MNTEIIERSSGFWVVNGPGGPEGPFDSVEEAQENCSHADNCLYRIGQTLGGCAAECTCYKSQ